MRNEVAPFESLIASPGRLRILTALAAEPRLEFVRLRQHTHLTDGNLATHARRLETAGLVSIEKTFRDRKPVTHVRLTDAGRHALERHARELLEALGVRRAATEQPAYEPRAAMLDDDWID
jgi:DNA-binding MarR family transcriptional regulator